MLCFNGPAIGTLPHQQEKKKKKGGDSPSPSFYGEKRGGRLDRP